MKDNIKILINGSVKFEFESSALNQQFFDKDKLFLFKDVEKFKIKRDKVRTGNIYKIIEEVCKYYKINVDNVTIPGKGAEDTHDAKKMIALLTKNTHTRAYVGEVLGGKTHGNISIAIKKAEQRDSVGRDFDEALMFVKAKLIANGYLYAD